MTNPPATLDADTFSVRRTIHIAAPRETVWHTVTDPDAVAQWFGRLELSGTGVGAEGTITWPDRPPIPIAIETFDPPAEVAYRWCNDDGPPTTELHVERSTVFTFTLAEAPGGTELTVVETGFDATGDPSANMTNHRGGWDDELDKLAALLGA